MKNYKMNEICTVVTDYVANGSFASLKQNVEYLKQPNYARLIRLVDYHNNFDKNNAIYISKKSYEFLKKSKIFGGEIIISNVGNIGESFLTPNINMHMSLGPNCIMIKTNQIDRYIYYYFQSDIGKSKLHSLTSGSAIQKFNKTDFKKLEISIHEINQQQHIVNILGSLDDKIENNEKILKLLDKKLLMIYEKDLSKKIKTNNSYKLIKLSDVANFQSGYSYKGKDLTETSKVALMTIKNFDRNVGFKIDGFKNLNPQNDSKQSQIVELYDTVVAHTDLTQNAEIIGNAEMLLNKSKYDKIIASMDLVIVKPKKINKFLLYLFLHNEDFKGHALGYTAGTTVLHLNKKALQEYKICFPFDNEKLVKLENQIELLILKQSSIIGINLKLNELKQLYLKKFFG